MNEKLNEALEEISDAHIHEATTAKRRYRPYWICAIAAVLVVVLVIGMFQWPIFISAHAIAQADTPRMSQRPDRDDYADYDSFAADLEIYRAEYDSRLNTANNALAQLTDFFTKGSQEFLTGSQGNQLWSPINAAIGLAMLAEVTDGSSRQQILQSLGCADMAQLRIQVSALWESVYQDGNEASHLANSLWLEQGLQYQQDAIDALAYHYYADVYQGDLGSSQMNNAIGAWLNAHTGGLLKTASGNIALPEDTVLALYATLYFQSKWQDQFRASNNTKDVFHATSADTTVTYMNKTKYQTFYYWGDTFGAVSLSLKNGSQMWFILPDEGMNIEDVLSSKQYMQMLQQDDWENEKYMYVNLSVPKFDISGSQNLRAGLENMGITDVFSLDTANFSAITSDVPIFITAVNQAVRVQIDEEGVKAAAYIEFPGAMSPEPPEDTIDFILDRPFLFFITSDNIPLFAGVVNEP